MWMFLSLNRGVSACVCVCVCVRMVDEECRKRSVGRVGNG